MTLTRSRCLSMYSPHAVGSIRPVNQSRTRERIAGRSLRTDRGHVFGGGRAALLGVAAFPAASSRVARRRRRPGFHAGAADHPPEPGTRAVDLLAPIADGRRVVHGTRLFPQAPARNLVARDR